MGLGFGLPGGHFGDELFEGEEDGLAVGAVLEGFEFVDHFLDVVVVGGLGAPDGDFGVSCLEHVFAADGEFFVEFFAGA